MTFLVYMCVKLTTRDLYHDFYSPHLTSTSICGVTIAPRVCGATIKSFEVLKIIAKRKTK